MSSALEDGLEAVAGGEHPEDLLDRKASAANDRLTSEDGRVDRNALQKLVLVHGLTLSPDRPPPRSASRR